MAKIFISLSAFVADVIKGEISPYKASRTVCVSGTSLEKENLQAWAKEYSFKWRSVVNDHIEALEDVGIDTSSIIINDEALCQRAAEIVEKMIDEGRLYQIRKETGRDKIYLPWRGFKTLEEMEEEFCRFDVDKRQAERQAWLEDFKAWMEKK